MNRDGEKYPPAIQRWLERAHARDAAGLDDLLADDVVFESPVVHTPQRGKAITKAYLGAALAVLGNESFHYVGYWRAETSAVLEFKSTIDGIEIDGVDMIAWNTQDRIVSFKVMARPWKGLEMLRAKMAAMLEAMKPR
jgi:SnoaL-like domain